MIGATADQNKVGYALMANLYQQGLGPKRFNRKIFPVNPKGEQIFGLTTFPAVRDIPEAVDLAVIAVRADLVPQILLECAEKKVPAAIVISAGFKEVGEAGKILEERIASIARENNIALLGPNCLGTISPLDHFNASFAATMPPAGEIALLSQSGALGTALIDLSVGGHVGFSKFISLGNEASLNELDWLEYLAADASTKAILVYLEKLSDGPKFMELATRITAQKPLVILRAGRSKRGEAAALSHTGSLAPADAVFTAACRQAGAITVESVREFFNLAKLFQLGIRAPLSRLAILTNGGGPSVIATDLVGFSQSLVLADLAEATKSSLRQVLPPMAAVGNPVDIIGDALPERYEAALKILVQETAVDVILLMVTPQMMTQMAPIAELVKTYGSSAGGKPIIPIFLSRPATEIPNFTFAQDAIEALDALARGAEKPLAEKVKSEARKIEPARMMSFAETKALLAQVGLTIEGILISEKSNLDLAVHGFAGQPLALKAISPSLIHKTEAGAVKLNVKTKEEASAAWEEIYTRQHGLPLEGLLLQPMIEGQEVIVGMKRDAVFGPTILVGLGGIFTEILKDSALRVAPVTLEEAKKMILEIKARDILLGARGGLAVKLEALADVIAKISQLAVAHPEIKEIDLNPVLATPTGAKLVDVRILC